MSQSLAAKNHLDPGAAPGKGWAVLSNLHIIKRLGHDSRGRHLAADLRYPETEVLEGRLSQVRNSKFRWRLARQGSELKDL
jgi:hypothetical protein